MKRKLKVLLSILGLSTIAMASVGCSSGDSIKTGIDQLFCKHEYSEFVETKAPTCYEKGEQERTCDKCGKIDTKSVDTLEHNFKDGEFFGAKQPTCTEVGYTPGVKCADKHCNAVIQPEEIPALGHNEETIKGKPATCVEDGSTDEIVCNRCDLVLSESTVIKATDKHVWTKHEDTSPTCEKTGTQGGFMCESCGVTDGVEIIPVLEHNFEDGECISCHAQKTVLTVFKSMGDYENPLTVQENGLYSYTFASLGDYVRNDAVTIEKGETLVCDFSMSAEACAESGWFGVVFGDGTDVSAYPHSNFGMCYYDTYCGRYMINGEKFGVDSNKKIDNIFKFDGVNTNYRITLTYNEDGTYSYRLYRTRVNENHETSYYLVDKFLNFECPTPTSLMLCTCSNTPVTVENDFTLTDLTFYKLK